MSIITLLTDFGSMYPAAMKGVILSTNNSANIVDITHSIAQADVYTSAFSLYSVAEYFPDRTVHIAVVDPGVGTKRRPIAIRARKHYFVGPDNGLMIPAARKIGNTNFDVFEITNQDLMNSTISSTFHGRDIFAPVGAHLSKGLEIEKVGHKIDDYVNLGFGIVDFKNNTIKGKVIYIDDFGNIITNIPENTIFNFTNFETVLKIFGQDIPFLQTYGFVDKGDKVALISSSGFFEISINQGNAARELGINIGDRVDVELPKNNWNYE